VTIVHRVSLNADQQQRELLLGLDLRLIEPGTPLKLVSFDVAEDHPSWPQVKSIIEKWQTGDFVTTKFSAREIDEAEYDWIGAWHHGYPMPDDDFGYLEATYDLTGFCGECGIGKVQKAPFRMKNEPKWGRRHILQLNWVFDEYFVLPEVWEAVFRPLGVGSLSVVHHRTGKKLKTVVQLDVKDVATSALAVDGKYPSESCAVCGRAKYLPIVRGFWPPFESRQSAQLLRSREYFGSGASAWKAIIVAQDVYRAIRDHKLSGVVFVPLDKSAAADS
jgi:hypothetical protein